MPSKNERLSNRTKKDGVSSKKKTIKVRSITKKVLLREKKKSQSISDASLKKLSDMISEYLPLFPGTLQGKIVDRENDLLRVEVCYNIIAKANDDDDSIEWMIDDKQKPTNSNVKQRRSRAKRDPARVLRNDENLIEECDHRITVYEWHGKTKSMFNNVCDLLNLYFSTTGPTKERHFVTVDERVNPPRQYSTVSNSVIENHLGHIIGKKFLCYLDGKYYDRLQFAFSLERHNKPTPGIIYKPFKNTNTIDHRWERQKIQVTRVRLTMWTGEKNKKGKMVWTKEETHKNAFNRAFNLFGKKESIDELGRSGKVTARFFVFVRDREKTLALPIRMVQPWPFCRPNMSSPKGDETTANARKYLLDKEENEDENASSSEEEGSDNKDGEEEGEGSDNEDGEEEGESSDEEEEEGPDNEEGESSDEEERSSDEGEEEGFDNEKEEETMDIEEETFIKDSSEEEDGGLNDEEENENTFGNEIADIENDLPSDGDL